MRSDKFNEAGWRNIEKIMSIGPHIRIQTFPPVIRNLGELLYVAFRYVFLTEAFRLSTKKRSSAIKSGYYCILKLSTGLVKAVFSTCLLITASATIKTIAAGTKNTHQANGS